VPQFVSANQLVHHIEGLGKSAGLASDSTAARRVARSLDDLWTREGDRFGNSRVVEAAGAAYAELGQFDRAVAAYRLAVENRSADVRVRTIEQLANVEARLAAIRHRDQDDATPRKTPDGPDELFERSNQHLDLAFAIGATPERHAIRGSYYKKRATTESRKSTRNKMIRLSLAEYDAAIEVAKSPVLDVYHASLAIQMASLIDDDSAATERTMDVYVEMLQRLESQLPTLDSTSGTSYERSRPIDVRATSHVLHRRLADPGVQAELVDGFCAVMDVRAPFRHRMSVIDHYRDLDLLLARHSSRSAEAEGARAIADALDQYSLPGG
jgi:tetratricopeptide (TPR) repeat protein